MPQIGLAIGLCLSSGIVALLASLPEADFLAWGWRVAFLLSAVLVFVGIYIRTRVMETPEFAKVKAAEARSRRSVRRNDQEVSEERAARHGRALHRRRVLQHPGRVQHRLSRQHAEDAAADRACWACRSRRW